MPLLETYNPNLEYDRQACWNDAFNERASNDNYLRPKVAKEYADFKLKAFDEQFLPEPIPLDETPVDSGNELYKCAYDVRYFIETYCGITLTPVQYKILNDMKTANHLYDIEQYARQDGSTTIACMYILHSALFNSYHTIGIISHKLLESKQSKRKIDIITEKYKALPEFLKDDSTRLMKTSIEFSNGSQIRIFGCDNGSLRGLTLNLLVIDNILNVDTLTELRDSYFPMIASSKKTRVINFQTV